MQMSDSVRGAFKAGAQKRTRRTMGPSTPKVVQPATSRNMFEWAEKRAGAIAAATPVLRGEVGSSINNFRHFHRLQDRGPNATKYPRQHLHEVMKILPDTSCFVPRQQEEHDLPQGWRLERREYISKPGRFKIHIWDPSQFMGNEPSIRKGGDRLARNFQIPLSLTALTWQSIRPAASSGSGLEHRSSNRHGSPQCFAQDTPQCYRH
jgi:hypothetical protein